MEKQLPTKTEKLLLLENEELRSRLTESEEALNAIRNGETDAIVVSGDNGNKVFSLTSAETPYRIIIEEMNEGVVSLSAEGTILFCNHRFAELVSTPLEKIMGSDFIRFVAENDKPKYYDLLHAGLKERCRGEIACLIHGSNPACWYLSFNPLPSDMLGDVCIMALDISETKQKEEELRRMQETLEQRVIERTETLTSTIGELAASRLAAMNMMEDAVEAKDTLEIINKKLSEEIAERKQAEETLAVSETSYRRLFESAMDGILILNSETGQIEDANPFIKNMLGYTREELIGKELWEIGLFRDIVASRNCFTELQKNEYIRYDDLPLKTIDGLMKNVEFVSNVYSVDHHKVIQCNIRDITERLLAKQKLQHSEMQYRSLTENSPDLIARFDRKCRHLYVNPATVKAGRCSSEEYIGKTLVEVGIPEPEAMKREERIRTVFETGQIIDVEDSFNTADCLQWFNTKLVPEFAPDGSICSIQCIARDITNRKRTEEELAGEQYLMVALMNNSPDRIYFKDRASRFIRISKAQAQLFGLNDPAQAIGKSDVDFFTKEHAHQAYEDEQKIIRTGQPMSQEEKETWPDRPDTWVYSTKLPLRDKEGNILGTFGISIDISERKRSEEEVRRLNMELEQRVRERTAELSDLYNNAPCGYHLLDKDGLFVRINDTELKWLGYNREEIVGKKRFSHLLTDESARQFSMNFPVFKEQGWAKDLEFDMVRKDGSFLPVLMSGTSVTDSEGNYQMNRSTIIDNTERRQAEETMFESQQKLEQLNMELEAFAYSVSHDLRSPLRAINGFTSILLEEYSTRIDEEGQRLCRVISDNALKMGQLIDDLLSFSRLSRSAMNNSIVDMKVMVAAVYNETAEPEKKEKIQFILQELPAAFCDPVLFKQVWINLLSNAVKYTRKCENPTITVGYEQSETEVKYYIKDNGVGFEQKFAGKLFGVFQRLHSSAEFEGTGVGLAIVQRIINRHGGRVWAEGELNKGATFYFTLPHKK